ncbi:MAG: Phospholipase D [Candidatus Anoxychlamydiales bacterium]|nr:Phospholipase D [Candidatus Anoxychlamydiales bacterium]
MRIRSKHIFIFSIFATLAFCINFIVSSISPNLPKPGGKPILYSNQMRQDLKMTCFKALKKANEHIHLVMFGLTDPKIVAILNKQSQNNIDMRVYYDKRSSVDLTLNENQQFKVKSRALMHQKILVIDKSLVFLGSANLTTASLLMHDNLMIGFHSPEIANFLIKKTPYYSGNLSTQVGGQKIDIWLLPDFQNKAINKIINLIDNATNSIELAMFTFTHGSLVEALINAKKRGVDVKIAIDFQTKNGASKKAIESLKKENIEIIYNKEVKLCHHKHIVIDKKQLICGSANWTNSAFNKNYDCFLILYGLNHSQKKFLKKLWRTIELESSFLK